MSIEFIRTVYVKPDGVNFNSKSSNDDRPFREWKCDSLTEVYKNEGQRGLDREMVRMFFNEDYEINRNHPSVTRFRPCLEKGEDIYNNAINEIDPQIFQLIIDGDYSITYPLEKRSEAAKACEQCVNDTMKAAYERIAQFVDPPEKMRDTGVR